MNELAEIARIRRFRKLRFFAIFSGFAGYILMFLTYLRTYDDGAEFSMTDGFSIGWILIFALWFAFCVGLTEIVARRRPS